MMKLKMAIGALIALSVSCSNSGTNDNEKNNQSFDANGVANTGEVLFGLPNQLVADSIKIQPRMTKPFQAELKVEGLLDNEVQVRLKKVPFGSHEFLIQGKDASGVPYAQLVSEVKVVAQETTVVKRAEIALAAELKGFVSLKDEVSHGEIKISLEGTDLVTTTDGNGYFTLSHLPPGTNGIRAQKGGFRDGQVLGLELSPGATLSLEPLVMIKEIHQPGTIFVDRITDHPTGEGFRIYFVLVPQNHTGFMRYGESREQAAALPWAPLKTYFYFDYATAGRKNLSVQLGVTPTGAQFFYDLSFELQGDG